MTALAFISAGVSRRRLIAATQTIATNRDIFTISKRP